MTLFKAISISTVILVLSTTSLFAQAPKEEIQEVENIKIPPRDIKDILKILEQTKQDPTQIEKAKAVLALPTPKTEDAEVLNHFYCRRATAEGILGNSKEALVNLYKVVNDYPSRVAEFRIDELVALATLEADRGNRIMAIKYAEHAKEFVSNQNRGRLVTTERIIQTNCLRLGDFDCEKALI